MLIIPPLHFIALWVWDGENEKHPFSEGAVVNPGRVLYIQQRKTSFNYALHYNKSKEAEISVSVSSHKKQSLIFVVA